MYIGTEPDGVTAAEDASGAPIANLLLSFAEKLREQDPWRLQLLTQWLLGNAADIGPEFAQGMVDRFVASIDGIGIADAAFALCAEGG